MNRYFADAFFYLALFNRRDHNPERVREFTASLRGLLVTTEYVLAEVGDAMATSRLRQAFPRALRRLRSEPAVEIVPGSTGLFQRGVQRYEDRPDKQWSLTDCISFAVMEERGIREALTGDRHFEQA
jgi:predicted nucleic acid-binding protein